MENGSENGYWKLDKIKLTSIFQSLFPISNFQLPIQFPFSNSHFPILSSIQTMTQQPDFEQEAKQLGERLGLLLAASDLPQDVKEGFIAMLPEMTPEQIDRLMKTLEAQISDTQAQQDKKMGEAMQQAQVVYEEGQKAAQDKALAALEEIEKTLKD